MDTSSNLRKTKNIFYPPALRIVAQPSSQVTNAPKAFDITQLADAGITKATSEPTKTPAKEKEISRAKEISKEIEVAKEKETEPSKPPPAAKANPTPSTGN